MQAFLILLILPVMLLNALGGVVAFFWLMIIGDWETFFIAFAGTIFGTFICGLSVMPALLATVPSMILYKRGGVARIASYPLMLVGLAWNYSVMCAWALQCFAYFMQRADSSSSVLTLLVAYTVATVPWGYMAQKESETGGEHASTMTLFLQFACAIAFVMLAVAGAQPFTALIVSLSVMGVALLFSFGLILVAVASDRAPPVF
jgi:hypothetical protein